MIEIIIINITTTEARMFNPIVAPITTPAHHHGAGADTACVHEITAAGFDGGDDSTDDRVLWVIGTTEQVRQVTEGLDAGWGTSSIPADDPNIDFNLPKDFDALRRRLAAFQQSAGA